MKKILKVEFCPTKDDGKVCFKGRVVEQSHRGFDFGEQSRVFGIEDCEFELNSFGSPELGDCELFVRGDSPYDDFNTFLIPSEHIGEIIKLIEAYNEYDFPNEVEKSAGSWDNSFIVG